MNIVLVSQEFPPETAHGGIGTQYMYKALGLQALGHQVHVISHSVDDNRHESTFSGLHVIRIPGFQRQLPEMTEIVRWLTYSTLVARELEQLQKTEKIDLIDFPEWAAEAFVYLLNRREWSYVPVVIHLQGPLVLFGHEMGWPDPDSSFFRIGTQMEATCVQMADSVYSSSECSAGWIRKYYKYQVENIPVIHTGVDTDLFKPLPVFKEKNPTLVFSGKIVHNKGVIELVESACILSREFPGLKLILTGKGEDSLIRKLRERADEMEAPDLLEFTGFIPKEKMPEQLCKGDVFVAPSWYEGGPGFVYLEAMACGLPVIGCSGSGLEENIFPGYNGFLVPPKDTGALIQVLRKILSDRELKENMGKNARDHVLKNCDYHNCIRNLEEYCLNVIENHKHTYREKG